MMVIEMAKNILVEPRWICFKLHGRAVALLQFNEKYLVTICRSWQDLFAIILSDNQAQHRLKKQRCKVFYPS